MSKKEERAKENAAITDQPGISFLESALNRTKAKANARDSKENVITAEKSDIQPANAPRKNQMRRELGSREVTKELGAKEESNEKAKESGK